MKILNKKLSTKLAIFSLTTFVFSFFAIGIYFYIYLQNDSYKKAKSDILRAFEKISQDINKHKNSLIKQAYFLNTDKSIISLIYLINNYEDKNNYNAILFDEEKKIILENLLTKAKFAFNDKLMLYDKNNILVAGVKKIDDKYSLFFSTYIDKQRGYYVAKEGDNEFLLNQNRNTEYFQPHRNFYITRVNIPPQITLNIDNNQLLITAHHSIFDKDNITKIAHLKISKKISQATLNIYDKNNKNKFEITTNDSFKNMAYDFLKMEKFQIKEDKYFYMGAIKFSTVDGDLYVVIKQNKEEIFELLKNNLNNLVMVLTIIAIIYVLIIYFIYHFLLINPLNTLMDKIKKIKNREFENLPQIKTEDELEEISKSIDNLAHSVKEKEKELNYIATHDALTNLYNRYYFNNLLKIAIDNIKENQNYLSLIFIDIDQFKLINDTLGHDFGDKLLIKTSKRLYDFIGQKDSLSRIGGDEFMIVISNINIKEKYYVTLFLQRLQKLFETPFMIDDKYIKITFSFGIVLVYDKNKSINNLYKEVDIALYKSKAGGRDRFTFYENSFSLELIRRNNILNELKKAVENFDEFFLLYQPKISTKDNKTIAGVEALIRWHSKELGIVSPNEFIPIAEESLLIKKVGYWTLKKACEDFLYLQKNNILINKVSINLSAIELQDKNFLKNVKCLLNKLRINPSHLEFEITERVIANDNSNNLKILYSLRNMNIDISIDDFGTGYSSLSYLQKLPVTRLKIDKSFISGIDTNKSLVVINKAMVSIAKAFELYTTAEGVEREEEAKVVKSLLIDDIQGYYFAKPMKIEELIAYIKSRSR